MPTTRNIKVFIASPGDLAIERRAFKDTIDNLNTGFGRGADVEFESPGVGGCTISSRKASPECDQPGC